MNRNLLCTRILQSYRATPHQQLIPLELKTNAYDYLFQFPIPILAHSGTPSQSVQPKYTFVNKAAIDLFQYPLDEFIGLESTFSASKENRIKRDELMMRAARDGFVMGINTIRVRKNGKQFEIIDGFVWNIVDRSEVIGQVAMLPKTRDLD
jgi:PAS domain-containing protein